MPRLPRFRVMLLIALMLILSYYWYSENSCSYCFEQKLAKQVPENFSSVYVHNTVTIAKHHSFNFLSRVVGILPNEYLVLLFYIIASTVSVYLFFRFLFDNHNAGLFSAFVYLTSTTLPVMLHFIFYYFLALFCLYVFINYRRAYIIPVILLFFLTLNSDVSAGFVFFITVVFLYISYFIHNFNEHKNKTLKLLILAAIILIFIGYERNFVIDFIERFPLIKEKLLFYISSYPKGTYFYLYILQKLTLIFIPLAYLIKRDKRDNPKENFIFMYLISSLPLLLIFISFDISARIFDYYSPLLGAITFKKAKLLFRRKIRKTIFIALIILFTFFSVYAHYIPPRNLEKYDPEFLEGLKMIPKDSVIYTDTFVASSLIKMDYFYVRGADFNRNDEYYHVYYAKNGTYIQDLFSKNGVEYFVISKHSLIRGLDVLNAPHFLKPISNIEEYDKMPSLSRYYNNEWVTIWKVEK